MVRYSVDGKGGVGRRSAVDASAMVTFETNTGCGTCAAFASMASLSFALDDLSPPPGRGVAWPL